MTPVRANWERTLLVCRKCSRRNPASFGEWGERLAKALRRLPGFGKSRKARVGVVETSCLGLCPKRGVAMIDAARPGRWLVVGRDDDLLAVLGALDAGQGDQA